MVVFDTQHKTHLAGGKRECERVSYFLLDSTWKNQDMATTPARDSPLIWLRCMKELGPSK